MSYWVFADKQASLVTAASTNNQSNLKVLGAAAFFVTVWQTSTEKETHIFGCVVEWCDCGVSLKDVIEFSFHSNT